MSPQRHRGHREEDTEKRPHKVWNEAFLCVLCVSVVKKKLPQAIFPLAAKAPSLDFSYRHMRESAQEAEGLSCTSGY
jgi:hypothetical protein